MKNLSIKNRFKARKRKRLPLVSVVMPVYNAQKNLPASIESILTQTYKRFELIIVDDSSTDNSLKIAKSYKRRFRRKINIIISGKNLNGGGDMCANLGIERARGKYIARMDADDIAAPQRLEKQVDFLEHHRRVFLVGSNAYVINRRGSIIGEKLEPTRLSNIYRSYATFHPIINPTVMLRRVFKRDIFCYQIRYSANNDYYTFFKFLCKGYIFANLPEKLIYLRIHDKNDLFIDMKKKILDTIRIRLEMVLNFNYKPSIKDLCINIAQGVILLLLPETAIKHLYMVISGIIRPKRIDMRLFERLITPSPA